MRNIIKELFDGEIRLQDLTLEEFNKGRPVYETYLKARARGFEAEHVHSVATQIKHYNEAHNTSYKASERAIFAKETGCLDDSCYRMTCLEHIINHYLKAKENPEELSVFYGMINYNLNKLGDIEKITLDHCVEFARLRESAKQKVAADRRGIPNKYRGKTMKEITGDPNYVSPKKGKTIQEITGDPNYVNPIKGKTMKEITGNPNYVSPLKGKTIREITGDPSYISPNLGKTKAEIVGDPNYINPRLGKKNTDYSPFYKNAHKGKTMKEITGNPNYTDPKQGKTMKEYLGDPNWEYKWKGKSMAERSGNPNYTVWNKGVPNKKGKALNNERYNSYKKEKEEGTFSGTWNEYQHLCRLREKESVGFCS